VIAVVTTMADPATPEREPRHMRLYTQMNWPLRMEKRPQQFILRRTVLRGAHFALPSIWWNCWSDPCIL
jgi:hypothetical protein